MILNDNKYLELKSLMQSNYDSLEKNTNLCAFKNTYKLIYSNSNKIFSTPELFSLTKSYIIHPKYKLMNTYHTRLIVVMMYNALNRGESILLYLEYLSFIFYNLILNANIKYCDDNIFRVALESVKSLNLAKKLSIHDMLKHIAKSVDDLYKDIYPFKYEKDSNVFEAMIYSLRTRIAQTMKPIVRNYYKLKAESKENVSKVINYSPMIDSAKHQILMLGYVPVPKECVEYKKYILSLKDMEPDEFEKICIEVFNTIGLKFSQQKVTTSLHKLNNLNQYIDEEKFPKASIYCFIKTIYNSLEE